MKAWHHELLQPLNERGLVSLANDFLASWTPADVAVLPQACRPPRMRTLEDLHYWRHVLADAYCGGEVHGHDIEPFRRMLSFFISASDRAREIQAAREARETGAPPPLPAGGHDSQPSGD